jgi:hypothetical protein
MVCLASCTCDTSPCDTNLECNRGFNRRSVRTIGLVAGSLGSRSIGGMWVCCDARYDSDPPQFLGRNGSFPVVPFPVLTNEVEEIAALPNKELKLTKPSQDGASQLNSVFGRRNHD